MGFLCSVADLVFTTQRGRRVRFYFPHFADEETKVHGEQVRSSNSHQEYRMHSGPKPSSSDVLQHLMLCVLPSLYKLGYCQLNCDSLGTKVHICLTTSSCRRSWCYKCKIVISLSCISRLENFRKSAGCILYRAEDVLRGFSLEQRFT